MEPWVVATGLIFVYLVITLVIGVVANRRLAGSSEDFLLYGRAAGPVVLYLTVVATYHSAFAFLGSGGFFYRHGVGFWVAGCWTILVGVITYTLGVRIWFVGKESLDVGQRGVVEFDDELLPVVGRDEVHRKPHPLRFAAVHLDPEEI